MTTDFSQKHPEEILKVEALAKYREDMKWFHLKLTELHFDVFILENILNFPFDLFCMQDDMFLRRVVHNFFHASVLNITKLENDAGPDTRTLRDFKNFVSTSVKDKYKSDFHQHVRTARFERRIKQLFNNAKVLRDSRIAHSLQKPLSEADQANQLTFRDLKSLRYELTRLFEVASFSSEYRYLMASYDPNVQHSAGSDSRPDIEKILDSIAKESSTLNTPERDPQFWPYRRAQWSQDRVDRFNHYRRKFGLSEV